MADILAFPGKPNMQQPKLPQFLRDERTLEDWFFSDSRFQADPVAWLGRRFSLHEIKDCTKIPLSRLPDVLRRCGWSRVRDREHGIYLWTRATPERPGDDYDF